MEVLDNVNLPGKSTKFSRTSSEEIPEALREIPDSKRPWRWKLVLAIGGTLGLGVIALLVGTLLLNRSSQPPTTSSNPTPTKTPAAQPTPTPEPLPSPTVEGEINNLLGHLPYQQAPESSLEAVTADGSIRLRSPAAQAFEKMQAAAAADGVDLVPLSGFRSTAEQKHLFFDIKAQRGQVTTKRAEVSAPPGYSEHHTGYAIDLGDAQAPETHIVESFEQTEAFAWLKENAAHYSFELSFPRDNPQGISYEPWHWRYVGNQDSLETFYRKRE